MDVQIIASGSTGNCYIVSDGVTRLILEAGIPVAEIQKACGHSLTSCWGCLVSHSHGDHAGHVKDVLKKGVDVYASAGTVDACKWSGHRVHKIAARKQFTINTWTCMGFEIDHDAPDPLGFLIQSSHTGEKLLYFSDTAKLRYQFRGVTHMMCECNYDKETLLQSVEDGTTPVEAVARICESHMGLDALLAILAVNDLTSLRKLYLIHLSNRHANEKAIKKAVQQATGVEVIVC